MGLFSRNSTSKDSSGSLGVVPSEVAGDLKVAGTVEAAKVNVVKVHGTPESEHISTFHGVVKASLTVEAPNIKAIWVEAPSGKLGAFDFTSLTVARPQQGEFPGGTSAGHTFCALFGGNVYTKGNVEALSVSVEGDLNAPVGRVLCGTAVECGSVWARTKGGQPGTGRFDGDVNVAGAVQARDMNVTGDIRLVNADCAEEFEIDATSDQAIAPGTVMILGDGGRLRPSSCSYDKRVAGVVSGAGDFKPGIILGNGTAKRGGVTVALIGRVACNVDATVAPIEVGDLLTTSETPGYAMKASDPSRAFGAVIGKALRPLGEGKALLPILVALQ